MTDKHYDIDPGPRATTPEQIQQVREAKTEARALIQTLYPLNLSGAADYIRDNLPSAEAIAMLGYEAYQVFSHAQSVTNGRWGAEVRYQKQANLNQALQEIVNISVKQLIKEGERATVNNVLDQIIMNQEKSIRIFDCEIEIGGNTIECTHYDGKKKSLARRSFERYVTEAKKLL